MIDRLDYERKYLEQYDGRFSFEPLLAEARRRQVARSIAQHGGRRVLEIGCGAVPVFAVLGEFESCTVVEPSAELCRRARVAAEGRPVTVVEGIFEDVAERLAEGGFDFIVASSLLHEVPDAGAFLAAIRNLCLGETIVHLNVPNVRSFHRMLAVEARLIENVFEPSAMEIRFRRQRRFDRASLHETVEREGFQVLDSGTYFVKPFTNAQMEQLLQAGIIDLRIIIGLEGMIRYMPELGAELYVDLRRRGSER